MLRITEQEAAAAKARALYRRLRLTDPEKADEMLKAKYKQMLTDAAVRGPIRIPFDHEDE